MFIMKFADLYFTLCNVLYDLSFFIRMAEVWFEFYVK